VVNCPSCAFEAQPEYPSLLWKVYYPCHFVAWLVHLVEKREPQNQHLDWHSAIDRFGFGSPCLYVSLEVPHTQNRLAARRRGSRRQLGISLPFSSFPPETSCPIRTAPSLPSNSMVSLSRIPYFHPSLFLDTSWPHIDKETCPRVWYRIDNHKIGILPRLYHVC
jgi:hypothetical protein